MNRFLFFIGAFVAILLAACSPAPAPVVDVMKKEAPTAEVMTKEMPGTDAMMGKLPDQLFAAHFVSSAPKHADALAKAPDKVLINFNFTLAEPSVITVLKDEKPIEVKAVLAADKLSMSVPLPSNASDGLYLVKYKACWPDKSCHDGLFAFKVDSKMAK